MGVMLKTKSIFTLKLKCIVRLGGGRRRGKMGWEDVGVRKWVFIYAE